MPKPKALETAAGKVILKGKHLSIKEASPDARIYKTGYVVGGFYSLRKNQQPDRPLSNYEPPTVKERLSSPDHIPCPGCGDTGAPGIVPFGFQRDTIQQL